MYSICLPDHFYIKISVYVLFNVLQTGQWRRLNYFIYFLCVCVSHKGLETRIESYRLEFEICILHATFD